MITAPTEFSGLQVWLDASDTTRLFQLSGGTTAVAANLDPVGYWGDKSGNNRHFTNIGGSTTTRPTWVSSLSTVRFDGTNDYLSSFFNITYTAQTVFVVVSQRAYASSGRIYTQVSSGGADSTTGYYIPCLQSSTTNELASLFSGFKSSVAVRGLSSFNVFTSWMSSTSGVNFSNGSSGSYYGATINYAVALSRIGATATTANNYFNGDISEVIVYNRALTNNERADVEYYLTRKWNFLNSIPRQVYGIKNGLWSLTDTWSVSAEPSPWNFPLSADNAYTNTFTITADSSTKVDTIRNSALAPNIASGGSFVLANGVSLSANVAGGVAPYTLTLNPAATATLVGNIGGAPVTTSCGAVVGGNSSLTINGNVRGGTFNTGSGLDLGSIGLSAVTAGPLFINGNIDGGAGAAAGIVSRAPNTTYIVGNVTGGPSVASGIVNLSTGTILITGTVSGGTNNCSGVVNAKTGSITVLGNVIGSASNANGGNIYGISNTSTGNITVSGDVLGGSVVGTAYGLYSTTNGNIAVYGNLIANNLNPATFVNSLSVYRGNIINAPNGQAIYAPRYQVFPTGSAQYTRQASNGYDSYVDYWTSNSTFSYPASSDVALGTTYANGLSSGSMAVPSPSSVALGALVGTTTGTASITFDNVLSQPIANLTTPNSIGARLKNITTSQALSAIVDSLEF
jgi:hypothetical protein